MTDLDAETRREVEQFVSEWVREHDVPGTSVAVVDEDGLAYAEGFGARDRAANAPATPDTLYGFGSCTKSVTAVAIMQLAETGDLSVEDSVDDYLPHLREVEGDPITIHDLLCHSSGMPSDGNLSALVTRLTDRGDGDSGLPITGDDDFRRHVESSADERLTDRERFFYYNTGYTLLGQIVEEVSGRPFTEYVAERVHDPLGMDRSCFSREAFEAVEDRMTGYNLEDADSEGQEKGQGRGKGQEKGQGRGKGQEKGQGRGKGKEDGESSATEAVEADLAFDELTYAPGGMLSSVAEMANYVRMYLGEGTFEGERVLSPESISRMAERHATRDDYLDERAQGYGYGLSATEFLGDTLVGHGGMMGTTTAWFGYLEDAGVGVVTACNTAPEKHPSVVGKAVLALVEDANPHETVPAYMLDRKAEPLVGEYANHREVRTATVEQDGGGLEIAADDPGWSAEYRVFPESLDPEDHRYYTVTARGKRVPVEFVVEDDDVSLLLQRWRLHKR